MLVRMADAPLLTLDLPGIPKLKSGKVREVFDLGDRLLLVATDRISAFDCVMPNGIPRKGEVLTRLSPFLVRLDGKRGCRTIGWPGATDRLPATLQPFADRLASRSMIVKKCGAPRH